jgi:hypothetical protein
LSATLALSLLALFIVGCGIKTVESTTLEADLRTDLEKALRINVLSVSCPAGERLESGNTFPCEFEVGTKKLRTLQAVLEVEGDESLRVVRVSQTKRGQTAGAGSK